MYVIVNYVLMASLVYIYLYGLDAYTLRSLGVVYDVTQQKSRDKSVEQNNYLLPR